MSLSSSALRPPYSASFACSTFTPAVHSSAISSSLARSISKASTRCFLTCASFFARTRRVSFGFASVWSLMRTVYRGMFPPQLFRLPGRAPLDCVDPRRTLAGALSHAPCKRGLDELGCDFILIAAVALCDSPHLFQFLSRERQLFVGHN